MHAAGPSTVVAPAWSELLPLVADRVLLLHSPAHERRGAALSGGDVDCAVEGLDVTWPLRLPPPWRLVQSIRYEWWGRTWIVEADGDVVSVDTLEDPKGLGMNGFPTVPYAREPHASPALLAAYLTAKRVQKQMESPLEWARIGELAGAEPDRYTKIIQDLIGRKAAALLAPVGLEGRSPSRTTLRRARAGQIARRFRTPSRAVAGFVLGTRRIAERLAHPTGLVVLVAGPDGAGKSTLAADLPVLCDGVFRRRAAFHFRPGVLPRPGALVGREPPDSTTPHLRPPHGRALSMALLGYHWIDALLGSWARIRPLRFGTGLVIIERGWWDIAVDPRRYRLNVHPGLVRALGVLLPKPDLALLLEGDAELLRRRKPELPVEEIRRQQDAWRGTLPASLPTFRIDASKPSVERGSDVREKILAFLETRATARLGDGWTRSPFRTSGAFAIPRGPRRVSRAALRIHQPMTVRGRMLWDAARLGASVGALRLLPRREAPPPEVRHALAPHLPPHASIALWHANHPGRHVALIIDGDGTPHAVAKVATGDSGAEDLAREADAIRSLAVLLPSPLHAPRILAHDRHALILEPSKWRPRTRAWRLDEAVARALGRFAASTSHPAHGDFAPWNVLRTDNGWVVVDWEDAMRDAPPLWDLCHYIVQSHSLLGRPKLRELVEGFDNGAGWIGDAIRAYMAGYAAAAAPPRHLLLEYLRASRATYAADSTEGRRARAARDDLLEAIG